jgi:hypothetical protein
MSKVARGKPVGLGEELKQDVMTTNAVAATLENIAEGLRSCLWREEGV